MGLSPFPACIAAVSLTLLGACASPVVVTSTEVPVAVAIADDSAQELQPHELHELFERARRLVEERSGTSLEGLSLHIVDNTTINSEVEKETQRLVEAQFSNPRYANHFVKRIMNAQAGTYLALYSAQQDAVLVSESLLGHFIRRIDNKALTHEAVLALFVHEAVHAADDRRHNINGVRTLDFRAAFAQSAVFEGHAQWQARQLCAEAECLDGLRELDRFMFGDVSPNQRAQSSNAASRNVIEYAYVEGERFVDSLASRENGSQVLEELLSNPPVDPIQILNPTSWPNDQREQRNSRLIASLQSIDHLWNKEGYELIQTSPLKGVNLRADPSRREAAVDGFTRLLTAMAAAEIHATHSAMTRPVDLMILQSESRDTAMLFARTLHANNLSHAGTDTFEPTQLGDTVLLRTRRREESAPRLRYADTVIGVSGNHIIQVTASDTDTDLMHDFVQNALLKLADVSAASR